MQLWTVRAHEAVGESIKICLSCTQQKALYTSVRKLVSPALYKKHNKTKDKFQAASCKLQVASCNSVLFSEMWFLQSKTSGHLSDTNSLQV